MIISCPTCLIHGERRNLAEIIPDGLKIIRSVNGVIDFTIVKTKEFEVLCGHCMSSVLYKQPKSISIPTDITVMWGTIMTYYA